MIGHECYFFDSIFIPLKSLKTKYDQQLQFKPKFDDRKINTRKLKLGNPIYRQIIVWFNKRLNLRQRVANRMNERKKKSYVTENCEETKCRSPSKLKSKYGVRKYNGIIIIWSSIANIIMMTWKWIWSQRWDYKAKSRAEESRDEQWKNQKK